MKRENLVFATVLIIFGTVLLVVSVKPVTSEGCLLTADACYAFYVQAVRDWFIAYFSMGSALMVVAILFLYGGRTRENGKRTRVGESKLTQIRLFSDKVLGSLN